MSRLGPFIRILLQKQNWHPTMVDVTGAQKAKGIYMGTGHIDDGPAINEQRFGAKEKQQRKKATKKTT